jgi:hypothetical protein
MTHACQSNSTLKDMLSEASRLLATSGTLPAAVLAKKIDELLLTLEEGPVASADAEHEIVSIYVLAEIERKRARARALTR